MKSIITTVIAITAFAGLSVSGSAQMSLPETLSLSKESKLWIEGTSTMKSFSCVATKVEVAVSAEPGAAPSELVETATLVVPVAAIDCKNGTMNGHLRKALKADANPRISWKLNSYRVEGTTVVMNGQLTIAGTERPIELRATGAADQDGTIRMKGSTKFKMSEYGVKPPTLMLGTMKVGDPITVSFDLVLNP